MQPSTDYKGPWAWLNEAHTLPIEDLLGTLPSVAQFSAAAAI